MLKSVCLGLAIVLGVAAGANGLFMLISPETWYFTVPGVTSSGPFNQCPSSPRGRTRSRVGSSNSPYT